MLRRSCLILSVVLAGLMLAACESTSAVLGDTASAAGMLGETPAPEESPIPEKETASPEETPAVASAESIDCAGAEPHPVGSALAEQFDVPYEEIMGWYCAGYGFGEISIAYSLAAEKDMPVADVFALYAELMDWGEVERALASADEPDATEEPVEDDRAAICTGTNPHPAGVALAGQYDVPYEEIMGWFCSGFGFGEIDLAYSLSLKSGLPVDAVFAMKAGGMGWGQIKHELEGIAHQPGGASPPGHGNPHAGGNDDHPGNSDDHPGNGGGHPGGNNGHGNDNNSDECGHAQDDDQQDDH